MYIGLSVSYFGERYFCVSCVLAFWFHFVRACLCSFVFSISIVFGVECWSCVFVVLVARLTSKSFVVSPFSCFCSAIFRIIASSVCCVSFFSYGRLCMMSSLSGFCRPSLPSSLSFPVWLLLSFAGWWCCW